MDSSWEARVRQFVNAEPGAPSALELGLRIRPWAGGLYAVPAGRPRETVPVTAADLRVGLERHASATPADREWAFAVLFAEFIDLASLGEDPEGDRLLDQLWDLTGEHRP